MTEASEAPGSLVYWSEHPDSASAYERGEDFEKLSPLGRWRLVRDSNREMSSQQPPRIPVHTSGEAAAVPAPLWRQMVAQVVLDASRAGDVRAVRNLYAWLAREKPRDDPDGTVPAFLPRRPVSPSDSYAEPVPVHQFTHEVRGGASFSLPCA